MNRGIVVCIPIAADNANAIEAIFIIQHLQQHLAEERRHSAVHPDEATNRDRTPTPPT